MKAKRRKIRARGSIGSAVTLLALLGPSMVLAGDKKTKPQELKLTGLTMSVPASWTKTPPKRSGPMAPRAIYTIPSLEGDSQTGMVRITYFPGMKGKDELNINRWLGQVTRSDGKPSTRDSAKITKKTIAGVHLTIVDVAGTVRATMRGKSQSQSRMIAAIIDHPKGPHFVVVSGNAKLIKKWEKDIYRFLESAKVQQ